MGFSVLMVVGDKKGRVGVGLGKAGDVISAMRKGAKKAKKRLITVPIDGTTIPFAVTIKKGAGRVFLKPSAKGSGVIAGGPVRAVVEAAGIRDISAKILGSENQASSVYATFAALEKIKQLVTLKNIKLRSVADTEAEEQAKLAEQQAKAKEKKQAASKEQTAKPKGKTIKGKVKGESNQDSVDSKQENANVVAKSGTKKEKKQSSVKSEGKTQTK